MKVSIDLDLDEGPSGTSEKSGLLAMALAGALAGLVLGDAVLFPDYPPLVQWSFIVALAATGALIASGPLVAGAMAGRGTVPPAEVGRAALVGGAAGAIAAAIGEIALDTILDQYGSTGTAIWFALVWGAFVMLVSGGFALTSSRSTTVGALGLGAALGALAGLVLWFVTYENVIWDVIGDYEYRTSRPVVAVCLAGVGTATALALSVATRPRRRVRAPARPASAGGVTVVGTNGFAIASFVLSLVGPWPLGLVFGLVALSQIKRTGEQGRGLAIAGVVISAVAMVATAALVIALVVASP